MCRQVVLHNCNTAGLGIELLGNVRGSLQCQGKIKKIRYTKEKQLVICQHHYYNLACGFILYI